MDSSTHPLADESAPLPGKAESTTLPETEIPPLRAATTNEPDHRSQRKNPSDESSPHAESTSEPADASGRPAPASPVNLPPLWARSVTKLHGKAEQVSVVLLFGMALLVLYGCYGLVAPYRKSVFSAIVLSVAFHPKWRKPSESLIEAEARGVETHQAGKTALTGTMHTLLSLVDEESWRVVTALGLHQMTTDNKLVTILLRTQPSESTGPHKNHSAPFLLGSTQRGRMVLRFTMLCVVSAFARALGVLVPLGVLLVGLTVLVLVMSFLLPATTLANSVKAHWWKPAVALLLGGLASALFADVASVLQLAAEPPKITENDAIRRGLDAVGGSGIVERAQSMITAAIDAVKDFTGSFRRQDGKGARQSPEITASVATQGTSSVLTVTDNLYALLLLGLLYQFLAAQEHTVVYYGLSRLLRPLQPEMGERHSRRLERSLARSMAGLLTLLWRTAWFHFGVTYVFFTLAHSPLPFFAGVVAALLALFPLMPKRCSPGLAVFAFRLGLCFFSSTPLVALLEPSLWVLFLLLQVEMCDAWMLRSACCCAYGETPATPDMEGPVELDPFLVSTSMVLGLVAYGPFGIVTAPLLILSATVLVKEWDELASSAEHRAGTAPLTESPANVVIPPTASGPLSNPEPKGE